MLSWRTSLLTLSYGARVTAKQWFKLRWYMRGRLAATTC